MSELRERLLKKDVDIGPRSAGCSRHLSTRTDMNNYGHTSTCPRCTRIQVEDARTRIKHSEDCRDRVFVANCSGEKDRRALTALKCCQGFLRRQHAFAEHALNDEEADPRPQLLADTLDDDIGVSDADSGNETACLAKTLIAYGVQRSNAMFCCEPRDRKTGTSTRDVR